MTDDAELMRRAATGDRDSFRLIVERYKKPIYNYFLRSTGSREDAEDLFQNLFLALFRRAHHYRKTASFKTFIYRIASNMLASHYRGKKDTLSLDRKGENRMDLEFPDCSPEADPIEYTKLSQLEDSFSRELADLPSETASALELRVKNGFSYKEIAEIMGKSVSAVESMIFRGRKALAERMREYRQSSPEEKD